jgi:hypothetical protein
LQPFFVFAVFTRLYNSSFLYSTCYFSVSLGIRLLFCLFPVLQFTDDLSEKKMGDGSYRSVPTWNPVLGRMMSITADPCPSQGNVIADCDV